MIGRGVVCQSQRDCDLQPKVARLARPARTELPWVIGNKFPNRNAVAVITVSFGGRVMLTTTRLEL